MHDQWRDRERSDAYQARVRIELMSLDRALGGSVLVSAGLGKRGAGVAVTLVCTEAGGRRLESILAAGSTGRVQVIVTLPSGAWRLQLLSDLGVAAELKPLPFSWRPVGSVASWVRRSLEVAWCFVVTPRESRRRAGVTWQLVWREFDRAYHLALSLRNSIPLSRYPIWVQRFDSRTLDERARIDAHVGRLRTQGLDTVLPTFRILVDADENVSESAVTTTLQSVEKQSWPFHTVARSTAQCGGAGELDAASVGEAIYASGQREPADVTPRDLPAGRGIDVPGQHRTAWIMRISAGDQLATDALYRLATAAIRWPRALAIYGDDDRLSFDGTRCSPRFKPDWSPEHFRSLNFVGDAVVVRADVFAPDGFGPLGMLHHGNFETLLAVGEKFGDQVIHVPAVLLHRGTENAEKLSHKLARDTRALVADLDRRGVSAEVLPGPFGTRRLRYALPKVPPKVSVIVPTHNAHGLLVQCVESLLARSTFANFELIVVDNRSTDAAALGYLGEISRRPRVRVLRYDQPFNYSAINNYAARAAEGDVLLLLNNDTEVISPDWMEEMLGHLVQPGIGAVGAKLYFPDGRVQHAGDAVGPGGTADHLHGIVWRGEPGYCNRAIIGQEVSAVTGACMMTWKWLYEKLGGLDEKYLKVAFNDVDYCLRVQEAGYRVIFTPHAELFHHESATRGQEVSWRKALRTKREAMVMRARWRERMRHDPYYNPNLSYRRPDFSLNDDPRVDRPWE